MKGRSLGLLAATAALIVVGGLPLEMATGRVSEQLPPNDARLQSATTVAAAFINRAAKRDREPRVSSAAEGHTVTFRHPDFPSTTIAARVSEAAGAVRSRPMQNGRKLPAARSRQTVACEPVVSALTEIAKHLDVGRCVT